MWICVEASRLPGGLAGPGANKRGCVPARRQTGALCLSQDRQGLRQGAWSQQVCLQQPRKTTTSLLEWAALTGGLSLGPCQWVGAPGVPLWGPGWVGGLRRCCVLARGGPAAPEPQVASLPGAMVGPCSASPSRHTLGSLPPRARAGEAPSTPWCGLLSEPWSSCAPQGSWDSPPDIHRRLCLDLWAGWGRGWSRWQE